MTLDELLTELRALLDDSVVPYQFSDESLTRSLNYAIDEACIRTRVLQDSASSVCSIDLTANTGTYTLDPCIFAVRRIKIDGQRDPLERKDVSQMDKIMPGWDDPTMVPPGEPLYAVFNGTTRTVMLVPAPSATGTARLLVWRGPTENEKLDATDLNGEPAIPAHMHRELKYWAAAQEYLNPDSEVRNTAMANENMALFEAAYGRKPTLHEIRLWSTNNRRHVTPHYD